jgi:hypothetical protein
MPVPAQMGPGRVVAEAGLTGHMELCRNRSRIQIELICSFAKLVLIILI